MKVILIFAIAAVIGGGAAFGIDKLMGKWMDKKDKK